MDPVVDGVGNDITLKLHPEPRAPAIARRALDLIDGVDPVTLDTARLLVSELVTNSYRHGHLRGGDAIEVTVRTDPDHLHVEVADPGCGFPHARRHDGITIEPGPAENGWGLRIVDRLSDRWGVRNEDCTMVWFDIESRSASTTTN